MNVHGETVTYVLGLGTGLAIGLCVILWLVGRARAWTYSARVLPDGTHIPVRQTREAPPNERYQEWREGRWVDVPYEERGPWYLETYPR